VDRALQELGLDTPSRDAATEGNLRTGPRGPAAPMLAVDTRHLRADDELRRLFGSGALGTAGAGRRRAGQPARQHLRTRGNVLVRAKETWPPYSGGGGLGMTVGSAGPPSDAASQFCSPGDSVFCFTHSTAWHAAQADYSLCVNSGDPHRLTALLQTLPYHVGALLQLSELYSYTNEAARSTEMLERALYALEVAWHPSLVAGLTTATARMDGNAAENKPLFDAMFRHINVLGRKGCVRTALECCKLLLSLDGRDPLGLVHCIDYYALRAGEHAWLLTFGAAYRDGRLCSLPGTAYSLALASWSLAKTAPSGEEPRDEDPDARLRDAMLLHPLALVRLVEKLTACNALAMDGQWSEVLAAPPFAGAHADGSASLEHLVDLFVERHHGLWRPVAVQAWMKACAQAAAQCQAFEDWALLRQQAFPADSRNAFSHLLLSNFSDAAVRALPAEDNPFLRPPQRQVQEVDMAAVLGDVLAHLPPDQHGRLEHALADVAAAGADAGEQRNALRLLLESLFRPAPGGQAAPEGTEGVIHEPGDSDDERNTDWQAEPGPGLDEDEDGFEVVPAEWVAEWEEAMHGAQAPTQGAAAPDWDAPD
jgi:hypothetical protein